MKKHSSRAVFDWHVFRRWYSRRDFLKVTAATGAAAMGVGALSTPAFVETAKAATTPLFNGFDVLQAEVYSALNGSIHTETCREGDLDLGFIVNGDWVKYTAVDFGGGADQITARVSSASGTGGLFDVHLDSPTGTIITTAITPTKGIHDVYLVFRTNGSSSVMNLHWYQFSSTKTFGLMVMLLAGNTSALSGAIQAEAGSEGQDLGYITDGNWAKYSAVNFASGYNVIEARVSTDVTSGSLEIHIDSATGTLLGTVTVNNTGGWQNYTSIVQTITTVSGVHDVYLVFRSTGTSAIMNLTWLKLMLPPGSPSLNKLVRNILCRLANTMTASLCTTRHLRPTMR